MGTETWIISLPLSDSILYLKIIHPPNFREEPRKEDQGVEQRNRSLQSSIVGKVKIKDKR